MEVQCGEAVLVPEAQSVWTYRGESLGVLEELIFLVGN